MAETLAHALESSDQVADRALIESLPKEVGVLLIVVGIVYAALAVWKQGLPARRRDRARRIVARGRCDRGQGEQDRRSSFHGSPLAVTDRLRRIK